MAGWEERRSGMRRFEEILAMATDRKGGIGALEDLLATSRSRTAEEDRRYAG